MNPDSLIPKDLTIVSVNLSEKKGVRKHPVPQILIGDGGVRGDAHVGPGNRQISLLAQESITRFVAKTGRKTLPGEFAENITTEGMDFDRVAVLDRFASGDLLLEVTQIGKICHGDSCAIFREVGRCVMPSEGIFARAIRGGVLKPGDKLAFQPRPLRVHVVTLSDRASRGVYEDRSGPAVENALRSFFLDKRWHLQVERSLLPDDPQPLRDKLDLLHREGCDILVTTGGTGVGPRDVAPDVVAPFCDKLIPGIMEHIRMKYGQEKPNALLSRGVAGVKGETLLYTLPGSVKAVEEYMREILATVEHLLFMLHGLDVH